jgi:hypothetical protein
MTLAVVYSACHPWKLLLNSSLLTSPPSLVKSACRTSMSDCLVILLDLNRNSVGTKTTLWCFEKVTSCPGLSWHHVLPLFRPSLYLLPHPFLETAAQCTKNARSMTISRRKASLPFFFHLIYFEQHVLPCCDEEESWNGFISIATGTCDIFQGHGKGNHTTSRHHPPPMRALPLPCLAMVRFRSRRHLLHD